MHRLCILYKDDTNHITFSIKGQIQNKQLVHVALVPLFSPFNPKTKVQVTDLLRRTQARVWITVPKNQAPHTFNSLLIEVLVSKRQMPLIFLQVCKIMPQGQSHLSHRYSS